jgi:hypothetical protein
MTCEWHSILLIIQYEANLRQFGPLATQIDRMVSAYSDKGGKFAVVAGSLAQIVRSKLAPHTMRPALEDILAISSPSEGLAADVRCLRVKGVLHF